MPQTRADKSSQMSIGSDEAGIMAVVAAKMQSSWEKKREEKETRFLHNAKAELDRCIAAKLEEYTSAITELNSAYEIFVREYAQVEDEIRALWLRLLKEQQKMLVLSEKKHHGALNNNRDREEEQIKGMATAKKSVTDFGNLIASMEARM